MLKSQHYLRVSPTDVGLNRGDTITYNYPPNGITHGRGFESNEKMAIVCMLLCITHGRGFELVWWSGTSRLLEDEEWALSWVSG